MQWVQGFIPLSRDTDSSENWNLQFVIFTLAVFQVPMWPLNLYPPLAPNASFPPRPLPGGSPLLVTSCCREHPSRLKLFYCARHTGVPIQYSGIFLHFVGNILKKKYAFSRILWSKVFDICIIIFFIQMCFGVLKIRFPTSTSKYKYFFHSKLKTLISHLAFYIFKSPGPGWIVQRQTCHLNT